MRVALAILASATGIASFANADTLSGGTYVLRRATITRGGARSAGGAYALLGTIGQPAPGRASGGSYALSGGVQVALGSAPPPPASCGNGTLEPGFGEECDLGTANGTPSSCCSASCRFEDQANVCRPAAGPCDLAERCSGTSDTCSPFDAKSTSQCSVATDNCLQNSFCDGIGDGCPAQPFNNGALCSDNDDCTVTDTCAAGTCSPGNRVCDVSVPNGAFTVSLKGSNRTRALVVTCTSQSAATCDAEVVVPDTAGAIATPGARRDEVEAGEVLTKPLGKAKKVLAGHLAKLKLFLSKSGLTRLKGLQVGAQIRVVVRARVKNDQGIRGVTRFADLRRKK